MDRIVFPSPISLEEEEEEEFGIRKCPIPPDTPFFTIRGEPRGGEMPLLLSPGPEFISAPIFLGFHSGFTVSRQTFSSRLPLHCISFETSRERERATIKKYAQKFLLQRSSNRSSKELDERSEKFSLSLETETLRKSRIEINHPGEERAIKIKSRRRSGDISFPETIFRNAPPFLTDHAPNFYAPFLSHSRPAP